MKGRDLATNTRKAQISNQIGLGHCDRLKLKLVKTRQLRTTSNIRYRDPAIPAIKRCNVVNCATFTANLNIIGGRNPVQLCFTSQPEIPAPLRICGRKVQRLCSQTGEAEKSLGVSGSAKHVDNLLTGGVLAKNHQRIELMRSTKRLHRKIKPNRRVGPLRRNTVRIKIVNLWRHNLGDVEHWLGKLERGWQARHRDLRQHHRQRQPLHPQLRVRLHIKHLRTHLPNDRQNRLANTGRSHQRLDTARALDVQLCKHRHASIKLRTRTLRLRLGKIIQNLLDVAGNACRDRDITRR